MSVRTLRIGSVGEDVRAVQNALNRNGASLDPDGKFGNHTRDAVITFQQKQRELNPRFGVDGAVGPQTRGALFPLVAVTTTVVGIRTSAPGPLRLNPPISPFVPNLTLPPLRFDTVVPQTIPGLREPLSFPPIQDTPRSSVVTWQQLAQTQRQFAGLLRPPSFRSQPVDTFAVGVQGVFLQSERDNHVEIATGCLLQGPLSFQDSQGNSFTVGCFAQATWVDPIFHFGRFHLANPYAQVQVQGNTQGPTQPALQPGLFPVNINVDLNDDGSLQLNVNGGLVWTIHLDGNNMTSAWFPDPVVGFGLVGKFQGF